MPILPVTLDIASIMKSLTFSCRQSLAKIFILDLTTSTNDYLIMLLKQHHGRNPSGWLCLAEQQSHGRGRYGKSWFSPPGNIYLSLSWCYQSTIAEFSALSLVVAASLLAVLRTIIPTAQLAFKWPNDILIDKRKLAGILIENLVTAQEYRAVIGIGINMYLPVTYQEWSWLAMFSGIDRNTLIGKLLTVLIANLKSFASNGLEPFLAIINSHDCLVGRHINLITPVTNFAGTAVAINNHGELVVLTQHGSHQSFSYGAVSIR